MLVLKGTCKAMVRAMSIILRLSNALQDFLLLSVLVAIITLHVLPNCFVGFITSSILRCLQRIANVLRNGADRFLMYVFFY